MNNQWLCWKKMYTDDEDFWSLIVFRCSVSEKKLKYLYFKLKKQREYKMYLNCSAYRLRIFTKNNNNNRNNDCHVKFSKKRPYLEELLYYYYYYKYNLLVCGVMLYINIYIYTQCIYIKIYFFIHAKCNDCIENHVVNMPQKNYFIWFKLL